MITHPGINEKVAMELFPPVEQRIIRRFSQHFYVTRGIVPIEIGNATYRAFLMRPSDSMAIMLNVEREVVALLHPYETWEARTLKAYDFVYNFFDDERIDKSVRILISQCSRVTEVMRDYLAKDPEYPIVIPYTYANFSSISTTFLFDGIRNNHLTRDLFAHDNPLESDYYFFGRDALVAGVIDNHKSRQNSTIFGLRKCGKTSAINAIARRAKGAGVRTLTLNCENPSIYARRYNDLLAHLITLLRDRFNLKSRTISFPDDPAVTSDQFFISLSEIFSAVKSDVMIILDEIEHISPRTGSAPHWRTGEDAIIFWQILRAYFQSDKKFRPTFCFVGTNPSLLERSKINDIESPVYLFARSQFMPSLTLEDTNQMLKKLGFFMAVFRLDVGANRTPLR